MCSKNNEKWSELIEICYDKIQLCHAPYTNFPISACLELENGTRFSGVNIESSNYSQFICATTVAIGKMITETNKNERNIVKIAIYFTKRLQEPSSSCKQLLSEFSKNGNCTIYCFNSLGRNKKYKLKNSIHH